LSQLRSIANQLWPRLAAIAGLLLVWQLAVMTGLWARTALPTPASVLDSFFSNLTSPDPPRESIWDGTAASLIRLAVGLAVGILVGTLIGLAMAASTLVQRSIGSFMAGLQALPSISWLPVAILWFQLSERAVLFVVVIGAIPAVAIATAASLRLVPPLLTRAGRTLGARGWTLYRRVVLPAAVPGYIAGLQQAWALGWRALMAGELILLASGGKGLGHLLEANRQLQQADAIFAVMIMIMFVGMAVEATFGVVDRRVRGRRGLLANP
jgi:NitT/TauT family transport system permease protein